MCVLSMAERFQDARTVHNIHGNQTKKEVAVATGISQSLLSDIENEEKNRNVSHKVIAQLAKHYGVSADYLLGLSNDPVREPSAADELGLPPSVIKKIRTELDMETRVEDTLGVFLDYALDTPFWEEMGKLSEFVEAEMNAQDSPEDLAALYEKEWMAKGCPAPDGPFGPGPGPEDMPKRFLSDAQMVFRGQYAESMIAYEMRKQLNRNNPMFAGRVDVLFGKKRLAAQANLVCAYFRRILEKITGYGEYLDNWA